jgi:hypothetical protein
LLNFSERAVPCNTGENQLSENVRSQSAALKTQTTRYGPLAKNLRTMIKIEKSEFN